MNHPPIHLHPPIAQAVVCRRLAGKEHWGFGPIVLPPRKEHLYSSALTVLNTVIQCWCVHFFKCRSVQRCLLQCKTMMFDAVQCSAGRCSVKQWEGGRARLQPVCSTPENADNHPSEGNQDDDDEYDHIIILIIITILRMVCSTPENADNHPTGHH